MNYINFKKMVKTIKIRDDNTFKYKNINGKIEFNEEDIYIYINRKIFRFYFRNIIRLRYKGIIFKFNFIEGRIKVYEKEIRYCHNWFDGICKICKSEWFLIYEDGDWMTSDMKMFFDRSSINIETNKKNLFGKLLILEPVTSIGNNAFSYCENLTSVIIGNSVKIIGNNAFSDCYNLASITVNKNNETYTSSNDVLFDKSLSKLIQYPIGKEPSSYTIQNSIEEIGDNAFSNCSNLETIEIGNSVTSIGNNSFSN